MQYLYVSLAAMAVLTGCNSQPAVQTQAEKKPEPFTLTSFNLEEAPTVKLSIPEMHCQYSCAPKVFETLIAQSGVKGVKVEMETKTATLAIDEQEFDTEATIAALADVQFTNTTVTE